MRNFVQRWMLPVLAVSLLAACATVNSDPACVCLPIKKYDREFQRKLADEIEAAPRNAVWPLAIQDYGLIRNIVRGCK